MTTKYKAYGSVPSWAENGNAEEYFTNYLTSNRSSVPSFYDVKYVQLGDASANNNENDEPLPNELMAERMSQKPDSVFSNFFDKYKNVRDFVENNRNTDIPLLFLNSDPNYDADAYAAEMAYRANRDDVIMDEINKHDNFVASEAEKQRVMDANGGKIPVAEFNDRSGNAWETSPSYRYRPEELPAYARYPIYSLNGTEFNGVNINNAEDAIMEQQVRNEWFHPQRMSSTPSQEEFEGPNSPSYRRPRDWSISDVGSRGSAPTPWGTARQRLFELYDNYRNGEGMD